MRPMLAERRRTFRTSPYSSFKSIAATLSSLATDTAPPASPRTLPVAIAGLGRMGARHALHFLHRTPRAQLVAAFSPDEKEHAWARKHLVPEGVKMYGNYDEMLRHEGMRRDSSEAPAC